MKIVLARTRALRTLFISVCCLLLVVQPLRSVWLSLVLPRPWASTDLIHLFKVLTDFQNIPLEKAPMKRGPTQTQIRTLSQYVTPKEQTYPEFWNAFKAEGLVAEDNKTSPSASSSTTTSKMSRRAQLLDMFQPLLNATERGRLLLAFETFHEACQKEGLTYFIIEASLMGVIRHHGLIPWDDDIDVAMSVVDWVRIRDVLSNIKGFELLTQKEKHWKFYALGGLSFKNAYYTFPYIDIFFYDEDDTHIWAVSKYLKHDIVYPKTDIFPLQYRPFEGNMVPVPCNLEEVVHSTHNKDICVNPAWVHKYNAVNKNDLIKVNCDLLYAFYPFVFASMDPSEGKAEERLVVGKRVIHTMKVPVGCPHR